MSFVESRKKKIRKGDIGNRELRGSRTSVLLKFKKHLLGGIRVIGGWTRDFFGLKGKFANWGSGVFFKKCVKLFFW